MTKTELVFDTFKSKYCTWWTQRRISTPEKYASEHEQWQAALRPYSLGQVQTALRICRMHYGFRPPFPYEFVLLIEKSEKKQPLPQTEAAKRFFNHAREALR